VEIGFYGKLPSHGDFLRRRASEGFVRVWDAWLQACLTSSRTVLGDRWLDLYLTSPAWRFACAPGAAGPAAVAGVMAPSVDRVGRYFPITLIAELAPDTNPLALAVDAAAFFDAAERLVIDTLETERVDLEQFDALVVRLEDGLAAAGVSPPVTLTPAATAVLREGQSEGWQVPIGEPEHLASVCTQLLSHQLGALYAPLTVWWSGGSSAVEPSCLISRGLPPAETFGAMLDGAWVQHRWQQAPARVEPSLESSALLATPPVPIRLRSAAATNVGRVRRINQDAFVERPEAGLWAVADGLGGHSDGEVASRMVCDALTDFTPGVSIEGVVDAVGERLQQVNEHLLRAATRSLLADRCGSTVVTLIIRGDRLAVVWAGDSRAYRWRGGKLDQLTRDHSADASSGSGRHETNAITRAVGADATLVLDVVWDEVRPGDRYLLCTDGLTRMVPPSGLERWVASTELQAAVTGLIDATLEAGAPDNVTVLIAEASAETAT
jgi:type VI secretion system protein ImpM